MRLNFNCLIIKGAIFASIILLSHSSITYNPFDSYSNPRINSVYGTGNQLMDISYRAYCAIKCNNSTLSQESYSDDHCCEGNTVNEIECLSSLQCINLKSKFQVYVLKITILSYFIIGIVSSLCSFGIIYCITKDQQYKMKNSVFVSILIISGAFVVPIMVIYMISKYNGMTMSELFGANLDSLSSFDFIEGVEIKENTRRVNRPNLHPNRNELNNHPNKPFNEKAEIELKSN